VPLSVIWKEREFLDLKIRAIVDVVIRWEKEQSMTPDLSRLFRDLPFQSLCANSSSRRRLEGLGDNYLLTLTTNTLLWASIFLCLGLGCETTSGTSDASTTRRDTGSLPDSATLDTSGGGDDSSWSSTTPECLRVRFLGPGPKRSRFPSAASSKATCFASAKRRARCAHQAIRSSSRSAGTSVSLIARSSPAVELLSTSFASGSIVNAMRADGLFDTSMVERKSAFGTVSIAADVADAVTIEFRCGNFEREVLPSTTRAAAFEFIYDGI
jgi:hypothetical protein